VTCGGWRVRLPHWALRGRSSTGRARAWHARGCGFEARRFHLMRLFLGRHVPRWRPGFASLVRWVRFPSSPSFLPGGSPGREAVPTRRSLSVRIRLRVLRFAAELEVVESPGFHPGDSGFDSCLQHSSRARRWTDHCLLSYEDVGSSPTEPSILCSLVHAPADWNGHRAPTLVLAGSNPAGSTHRC
jgi:hypothetical protein